MSSQIRSIGDISRLGTILSVWAHPDDESFCCAGILAAAVQNGQKVICVTATKGEKGVYDENRWPANKIASIRTHEMAAALKALGITEHRFLDYIDGDCDKVPPDEGRDQVLALISRYQPDTILTFGPEGMTGHPDHRTVSDWVTAASRTLSKPPAVFHAVTLRDVYKNHLQKLDEKVNLYFNIDEPPLRDRDECDIVLTCDERLFELKRRALAAHESQISSWFELFGPEALNAMLADEAFVRAG